MYVQSYIFLIFHEILWDLNFYGFVNISVWDLIKFFFSIPQKLFLLIVRQGKFLYASKMAKKFMFSEKSCKKPFLLPLNEWVWDLFRKKIFFYILQKLFILNVHQQHFLCASRMTKKFIFRKKSCKKPHLWPVRKRVWGLMRKKILFTCLKSSSS